MFVPVLWARLALCVLFSVSGIAKLCDIRGFRTTLTDLGLPSILIPAVSLVIPLAELLVAGLLLSGVWAWWGGVAALALVLVVSGGLLVGWVNGRTPDCHCFGSLTAGQSTPASLLRNAAIAAGAAVVVFTGPGYDAAPIGLTAPGILIPLVAIAAIAAVFLRTSVRSLQRRRLADAVRQKPLPPGNRPAIRPHSSIRAAPAFTLSTLEGGTTGLEDLLSRRLPVVLAFISPDCRRCRKLESPLALWQGSYRDSVTIAIITRGSVEANRHLVDRHRLSNVLLQPDREVARAYGANRTPAAILIAPDGTLASGIVTDVESIADLVAGAAGPMP